MAESDQVYKRIILIEKYDVKWTPGYFAVGDRRIQVRWSREMVEDLQAYHPIDVEAELTALLAMELGEQIDVNIMRGFMDNLPTEI